MKKITIFTPTFNRAVTLQRLYDSLCGQTNQSFVWLIVDDGSTDGTQFLVKNWKEENKIEIQYFKQKNSGKSVAHNRGVEKCNTELFVCVDSDDYLVENAVEVIENNCSKLNDDNVAGLVASRLMVDERNDVLENHSFLWVGLSSLKDLYRKGFRGETTIVFKTNVIKKYQFPEILGEKFITECFIYDQIDQKYLYLLLDKPLVVCEYLPDGYTSNLKSLKMANPKGYALYYNQYLSLYKTDLKMKLKNIMRYIYFSKLGNSRGMCKNANCNLFLFGVAYLLLPFFKNKLI